VPAAYRKPIWLLPNLLSLDAPLVAMAWLYVFAKTWRLGYHPWQAYASLGLAVWVIYAADRLFDASMSARPLHEMQPRHRFHVHYHRLFKIGITAALVLATALVVTTMPMAIYKHLLIAGVLIAGFFGLSMISWQSESEVPVTKNVLAGVTFAFGTAMTAHVYRFEFSIGDMFFSPEFLCFAVLCILNISAIDFWEHAARSEDVEIKASDELSLTLPLVVLAAAALGQALLDKSQNSRPFFYAILTGAGLLYLINRERARFQMDTLRVLADAVMLLPVLIFLATSS